ACRAIRGSSFGPKITSAITARNSSLVMDKSNTLALRQQSIAHGKRPGGHTHCISIGGYTPSPLGAQTSPQTPTRTGCGQHSRVITFDLPGHSARGGGRIGGCLPLREGEHPC